MKTLVLSGVFSLLLPLYVNGQSGVWSALGDGVAGGPYIPVFAVAGSVSAGSGIYVGGGLTSAGGINANFVAHWDGAQWDSVGSGVGGGPNPFKGVSVLEMFDGILYAGGGFAVAGGVNASRIARWDGIQWSALGTGVGGTNPYSVWAIAKRGQELYIGGTFTIAGGVSANRIARWDGNQWSDVGGGVQGPVFPAVYAMAVIGEDLYVGGQFNSAGGVPANNIARWDGNQWWPLGAGTGDYVSSIAVIGTDVYVGGFFTTAGGTTANHVAKWDGTGWSALGSGIENGFVRAACSLNNILYVGGNFRTAGGQPVNLIAQWNGSEWFPLGTGIGGSGLYALATIDGEVYAGGGFWTAGKVNANCIATWSPTPVSVEHPSNSPTGFHLSQNYPNPFNPTTNFKFSLPAGQAGIVNSQLTIVKVYDLLGREVATLVNGTKPPGSYEITWDASGVSSGVYFYRLQAGDFVQTRKLVLMK